MRQKANLPTPKHMMQLTTWQVLCQVERRFHSQEPNCQTLSWDLGISPPSSNSLESCRIKSTLNIMLSYLNLIEPGLISTIQGSICLQCQLKFSLRFVKHWLTYNFNLCNYEILKQEIKIAQLVGTVSKSQYLWFDWIYGMCSQKFVMAEYQCISSSTFKAWMTDCRRLLEWSDQAILLMSLFLIGYEWGATLLLVIADLDMDWSLHLVMDTCCLAIGCSRRPVHSSQVWIFILKQTCQDLGSTWYYEL